MGNNTAIRLENVNKCFQIYDKPHHRLIQGIFRGRKQFFKEYHAIKDVSFEIKKGETVGIIGRNGAGKSTLLQMICGTLAQTSGNIEVNGRVAALLELGAGFNPEFTGRENVFMNATVLGLGKEEIDARFDDIAEFAGIGEFIEQPVKTYSSGMMVRLAFAVAINVDPEILIVDEALSVGDELFQRKCFSRIEAIRNRGATILFVSHSGATIVELCDHAVLMDKGEKLAIGTPKQIVGSYQKLLYAPAEKETDIREQIRGQLLGDGNTMPALESPANESRVDDKESAKMEESFDPNLMPDSTIEYETKGACIESPAVLTLGGDKVNNLVRGRSYRYMYRVRFSKNISRVRFGMLIKTPSGVELGGSVSSPNASEDSLTVKANSSYRVEFRFDCALNQGTYFLNAGVVGEVDGEETYLHRLADAAMFRVLPETASSVTGIVDFGCRSKVEPEN